MPYLLQTLRRALRSRQQLCYGLPAAGAALAHPLRRLVSGLLLAALPGLALAAASPCADLAAPLAAYYQTGPTMPLLNNAFALYGNFPSGSAPVGQRIRLTGINLKDQFGTATIYFKNNGVILSTLFASTSGNPNFDNTINPAGSTIDLTIPSGADGGTVPNGTTISVYISGSSGGTSNMLAFKVLPPPPSLYSPNPYTFAIGDTLGLQGVNLQNTSEVAFYGSNAVGNYTVTSGLRVNSTGTRISGIRVPTGAVSGGVTARTPSGLSNAVYVAISSGLTITSTSPAANARAAATNTAVAATFDQAVTSGSAAALQVFSAQRGGLRTSHSGSTTASGSTVSFAPTYAFQPGETVQATVTTAAAGTSGKSLAVAKVFQFTAATIGGSGTYGGGTDPAVGAFPGSVAVGDVDGDGDLDLVTANDGGTVSVRLNNGSGVLSGGSDPAVSTNSQTVKLGDVDGDGDLDLLAANYGNSTVSIRLNNGNGVFSGGSDPAVGLNPGTLAVGDVDGDGDLDFVTAQGVGNTASVRLNNGSGVFSVGSDPNLGTNLQSIVLGDVDGDGDLDLLTANNANYNSKVNVCKNNGTGTFSVVGDEAVDTFPKSIAVGDVDGDGDLDFVTANGLINTVSVRRNNGVGGFGGGVGGYELKVYGNPSSVALGDLDGDGDLDLLVGNRGDNTVSVRLNSGSGTFSGSYDLPVGTNPYEVALGDLDGDGDLDLVTANRNSSSVSVRLNANNLVVSTGTLAAPAIVPAGTYATITVTNGGVAQFAGDVATTGDVLVQTGGTLLTNCQALTGPGNFTLQGGATLGVCDPNGLDPTKGAIRMTGTLTFSPDGRYLYNGTAPQITGSNLPTQVRDLTTTNDQSLTLTRPLRVSQTLTLAGAGNFMLNGQPLTLASDASGTALVVNSGTGIVSGNTATMLRYLTTTNLGNGYRQYSSPVSGDKLGDLSTPGFVPIFNPSGYNNSATSASASPFPTVFGYDESRLSSALSSFTGFDRGWYSPAATDLTVPGVGYTVNIAGTQTEAFTGTLNTGSYTRNLTRGTGLDAGWALVGNPYPAPLDWSLVALADRPNLDGSMYVCESSSTYGGTYRAYTNGIGQSPLIGSSQGFFVRVSAGQTTGSLTFNNAQRITSYATQVPVRRISADPRPTVQLALRGSTALADVLYVYTEAGATSALDGAYDAVKMPNTTGLNLASVASSSESLAIDGRPAFTAATAIALTVGVPAAGSYTLTAAALTNLPAGLDAYLLDAQAGQQLKLTAGTSYSFAVTASQATALLSGRFTLRFSPQSALATATELTAAAVSVYPNPSHEGFVVTVPGMAGASTVQAELLNTLGQVVRQRAAALPATGTHLSMTTAELAAGVYTLRLQVGAASLAKRVVVY